MRFRRSLWLCRGLAAWMLLLGLIVPASAQYMDPSDPFNFVIENPDSRDNAGLVGRAQQLTPPGAGYARFGVEYMLRAGTPLATDLEIEFVLDMRGSVRSSPSSSVKVVIPKGHVRGYSEVLIPVPLNVESYSYTTRVDGSVVSGLSRSYQYKSYTSYRGSVVFITQPHEFQLMRNDPELRISSTRPNDSMPAWSQAVNIQLRDVANTNYYNYSDQETSIRIASVTGCPTNILDWTTVSKVVITADTLPTISDDLSDCLKQYVLNSGVVIVAGEGTLEDTKALVSSWLGSHASGEEWTAKEFMLSTQAVRSHGLGYVAAMQNVSLPAVAKAGGLAYQFPQENNAYTRTDARTSKFQTQDFWNWSLQQLGQPPVGVFAFLIAVFAGLASPALLFFCVRSNRSAWLLVILPIMALVGTSCLVVYATVHDGFGTYSRVRSLMIWDQNLNRGVCMSRQVFFAGVQPRDGVKFNPDSEVWVIESEDRLYRNAANGGELDWSSEAQIYRGLLKSREQFQFSVTQPIKNLPPIQWITFPPENTSGISDAATCEFRNNLPESISTAIISDGKKGFYLAQDIPANTNVVAKFTDRSDVLNTIKRLEQSQQLQLPEGLTGGAQVDMFDAMFGINRATRYGQYSSAEDYFIDTRNKLLSPDSLEAKQCFILYTTQGTYVDRALDNTDEQGSLHMIYGQWEREQQ